MYPIARHTNRYLRIPAVAGAILVLAFSMHGRRLHTQEARVALTPPAAPALIATARPHQHWYQFGRASWYGHALQGMETASGEAYDMNGMTCAHRSLPLGALVSVTNLHNHKSIVVRVNDRGPVPETRVVDLSYAAAQLLGFTARGTAPVRIDVISMKPSKAQVAKLTYPELPTQGQGQ
jgi:rare lipoprotein A